MTTDTVGGVYTYARDLIAEFRAAGVEVCLAVMGEPPKDTLPCQVHVRPYKLEWMEDPWEDVSAAAEWLLELGRDFAPDLVHHNYFVHAALPWTCPTVVVGHSCVMSWHQAVRGSRAGAYWDRYASLVAEGLRAASVVVAPSQVMLDSLHEFYGPLPPSRVIYNGRRTPGFWPAAKLDCILTAGRLWDEGKNVAGLQDLQLPWPVYAAGAGECGPGILPLGRLEEAELAFWFRRAGIFALPARYEPFGLAALEAALCGCALVLGDIPSLREVWGDAALFIAPNDRAGWRQTLLRLGADREERQHRGELARQRAQLYSSQRMAAGYLDLYREVK
jgi:glycogen synthase